MTPSSHRQSSQSLPDLNGLLIIDKQAGYTSHDVVARTRRIVGMKRVGHGGTLDPFATGVLVVAVGRATRVLQYVQNSDKRYDAHIVLGIETDSHDIDGAVTRRTLRNSFPGISDVESVIMSFCGEIDQIAPMHSAIKVGGRKLYERARAGDVFEPPVRRVTIHAIEICAYEPPDLHVAIHCGKGTYIRSLARDIGSSLGTGGYCHALRRTQNGPFCLGDSWTLDKLADSEVRSNWPQIALHPDTAIAGLGAILLSEGDEAAWYHGRSIPLPGATAVEPEAPTRVYGSRGDFLGVGRVIEQRRLKPELVFPAAHEEEDR
jgi:tRNA pseudouridine55 synthase